MSHREQPWNFGNLSPTEFQAHVRNSVPGYELGHQIVLSLSDHFVRENSVVYDLGCGPGDLLADLAGRHEMRKGVQFIGVDIEPSMVEAARASTKPWPSVQVIEADAVDFTGVDIDLVIAYYAMQFIEAGPRSGLVKQIFDSLNPGGALVLFEKFRGQTGFEQDLMQYLYTEFKLQQEFSEKEIVSKTRSIAGELLPFSRQDNSTMLELAGFKTVIKLFTAICFEGIVAVKPPVSAS